MEPKIWKIAAALGVPGVALAVFFLLYYKLEWDVAGLGPDRTVVLLGAFMLIVAAVALVALFLHRPLRGEAVVHRYDRLKRGLSTPQQNVYAIQDIANSTDPNKDQYLREFLDFEDASYLEHAATQIALDNLHSRKRTKRLFELAKNDEYQRIVDTASITGDALLDRSIVGLKYWRFLNRRTHPMYGEVETALSNALTFKNPEQVVATLRRIQ